MKHFFKGAAIMVGVIVVNIIINIVCNINGVDLNSSIMGTMSAVCALLIYDGCIKNEEKKESQE